MKILVRLPNWLGDMVMSVGVINSLPVFFPGAAISVIAKKGIHELLPFFPPTHAQYVFSKKEYPGPIGLRNFGREIADIEHYDLFICLPDSFSSAFMAWNTGSQERLGYKNEWRQMFLTRSYNKPLGLHRVEEYLMLPSLYTQQPLPQAIVQMQHAFPRQDYVVVNINSEASSRRLTVEKATSLLNALRRSIQQPIVLIGASKEAAFVQTVLENLSDNTNVESIAGKTSLPRLVEVLAGAAVMVTTDSGPAHLANALGTHTVVFFGAGNEQNTAPYNSGNRTIIRLGQLSCEPCEKNVCVRFGTPLCLEFLEVPQIINAVTSQINKYESFF
jgi:ADP-heptose:LPS heptosyltransferase